MPRKKKEQTTVKYYIPKGTKERIDHIVDTSDFYKNKPIWKQKFYILCDYIADQNFKLELDVDKQYVNIHQKRMARILSIDNREIATILKDAISNNLLKKDGVFKIATTYFKNGKKHKEEGKSYGYQFCEYTELEEIETIDQRRTHQSVQEVIAKSSITNKQLKMYNDVLLSIKIEDSNLEHIIGRVLANKVKKKEDKEKYKAFIKKAEAAFEEQKAAFLPNRRKLNDCYYTGINRVIVDNSSKSLSSSLYNINNIPLGGAFVPEQSLPIASKSKLCQPCIFQITTVRKKRKEKVVNTEAVQTTINRCKRSIYHINQGNTGMSRKGEYGRVFTTITTLNREFRTSILLGGKKIVGLDVANSQPLLASILIKRWWNNKDVEIPADVLQYQKDCERGQFYNNFMKELNVPDDLRSQFKQDFFNKVFFSKVIEKKNMLKDMFIDKYPNCWEAICDMKGGLYDNEQYKVFATALQEIEAFIIFDTVNMGLIERGIKAFNIFDSIYVVSKEDYEIAEQMTREAFKQFGLNPTFKMEYQEHL